MTRRRLFVAAGVLLPALAVLALLAYGFTREPRYITSWSTPPLTTIRQDLIEKGRSAGELALRMLNGERPGRPITISVELVVRTSTAPPTP